MKTKMLITLSAAIEAATGIALVAVPELVARVLLAAELTPSGTAVARLTGIALLSLGVACRPGTEEVSTPATRALFVYNLLAALYLAYLRVGAGFDGFLLWPAAALHAVLALLFIRPTFATTRSAM